MNEDLLIRFLNHTASSEDYKIIEEWISDEQRAKWLFDMEEAWGVKNELLASEKEEIDKAYKQYHSRNKEHHKPILHLLLKHGLRFTKYAAVIAIISVLGINLYKTNNRPMPFVQLEIPKGQYLSVTLTDGTIVWLNSESKLRYPTEFNSKERLVELEGEAFFEVAPDKKKPFIVKTELLDVKVLGTKFNMRAYKLDDDVHVSLTEGSVEVRSYDQKNKMMMKPNDELTFSRNQGMIIKSKSDLSYIKNWTKGELDFQDTPLTEICKQLERKFSVSIHIDNNELKQEEFTCHFKEGVSLYDILALLKATKKIDYLIKDNDVELFKYGKPMRK